MGAAFLAGWLLTDLARRYAHARRIYDQPNARSSHKIPTPLGGGWGIAVPTLVAVVLASRIGWLDRETTIGLGAGGLAVAVVGWIDDRLGLSAMTRALVQAAAAAWLVGWLGGLPSLDLGVGTVTFAPLVNGIALVAIVWCTNLYNFMDGIDGIAGLEAVTVGGVGGALLLLSGSPGLALVALVMAASSAGFLMLNRPPARIFMGDAGSGLLGFMIAGLAVASEARGSVRALVWIILLGAFVFDATIVLLRRIAAGERWYSAHRGHLYQRLVQSGWSHGRVDIAVILVNAILVLLAIAAWRAPSRLLVFLVAAAALLGLTYRFAERRLPKVATPARPGPP